MHTDIPPTHIFPHLRVEFAKNIPYISSSVWHECWIHQEYLKHIRFCVARVLNSPRIPQTYLLPCGTSVEFTKNTSKISVSVWHECCIHQEYLKHVFFRVARILNSPRIPQKYMFPCGTSVAFTKNTSSMASSVWHECWIYQEYLKIIVHSCGMSVEHTKNTSNISKTKYTCNTYFLSLSHECKTSWYTSKADVLLNHEW